MAFADLTATLNLNIANFSAKLNTAQRQVDTFGNRLNGAYKQATASLNQHNLGLKDTSRIVQGILVSQTFYGITQSIVNATASLWEFNKALDYTNVTYSALFGNANLARDFIAVLQEHSVDTIFDYSTLEAASKKLLAYGIEYENLMFIMKGLTDLSAMSGDADAMNRISRALGQIYTKGKLSAEEMRQLADAYVPIYEIIQSSFGLSNADMERVGDLKLPAHQVINEIVDYANEKFGSVGEAAMQTIIGLQNRVVDTLKVVGSSVIRPISNAYKSFLAYVANGLEGIRAAFTKGGIGGVFESLVPDTRTQARIRQFIANIHNAFMSIMSVLTVVGTILRNVAHVFMTTFNIMVPVIVPVINAIALLLQTILQTSVGATTLRIALLAAAGAFLIMRTQALSALVVVAVKNAVDALSKSLLILSAIIVKHPILTLLAALGIGLAGISLASNKANDSISGLFNKLSGFSGKSGDDVLQKIPQDIVDGAKAAEQFNKRLGEGKQAADDLTDSINGTGKAAKKNNGLLSFDEVFRLNDAAGAGGGGALGAIDNLLNGIGGVGGALDGLLTEIPDFSDYLNRFTDSLFGGLKDSLLGKLAVSGIGMMFMNNLLKALRTVITADKFSTIALNLAKGFGTAMLGAFAGYGFDAVASLITSRLWMAISKALKLSADSPENAALGGTIGSALGGAIGALVGGIPGSLLGAAIGHLAGGIVGLFWDSIDGAFSNTAIGGVTGMLSAIAKAFYGTISGLPGLVSSSTFAGFFRNFAELFTVTGVKALAKGGIIGAAIGFVTDAIAGMLWDRLAESFSLGTGAIGTAKVGQTIGSILGTIIGGLLGGPAGALIGGAIGTFAAGFVGLFWEKITAYFAPISNAFSDFVVDNALKLSVWWNETKNGFSAWVLETSSGLSTWFESTKAGFTSWAQETLTGFNNWFSNSISGLSKWFNNTVATFSDWDSINSNTLSAWMSDTWSSFKTWYTDTFNGLASWNTETSNSFINWRDNSTAAVNGWAAITLARISQWITSSYSSFVSWKNSIIVVISAWASSVVERFNTWRTSVMSTITGFSTSAQEVFNGFCKAVKLAIEAWVAGIKTAIDTKFNEIRTIISNFTKLDVIISAFCSSTLTTIKNWASDIWGSVRDYFGKAIDKINEFLGKQSSANNVSVSGGSSGSSGRDPNESETVLWENGSSSSSSSSSGRRPIDYSSISGGHATGGIFNREHIARFAEGNKAEAIIPLENASAMQPFVDAISRGILEGLAPVIVQQNNATNNAALPPMYVGTLVADERGLKQLYKKFELIQIQENARRGLAT